MASRPVIAITLGDPSGIGPEVIAKTLSMKDISERYTPLVVGSADILRKAIELSNTGTFVQVVDSPQEIVYTPGVVSVLDMGNLDVNDVKPGVVSGSTGKAAIEWVVRAGELCMDGAVAAMATAPIHILAASLGGYQDIGHMEILQRLSGSTKVLTMLTSKGLRVVHLTTHRSLKRACEFVTKENILEALLLTHSVFQKWGIKTPHLGVAALNPHASDGGLIGDEEETEISPAVHAAQRQGINVTGPIPADTIFLQGIRGDYDAVLAMYHDQGHIPVKIHGFEESITVNLGLPFIRTSVDHGTAFDIAWQDKADPTSMAAAVISAVNLASGTGL